MSPGIGGFPFYGPLWVAVGRPFEWREKRPFKYLIECCIFFNLLVFVQY